MDNEIILSGGGVPAQTISQRVARGELRRLGRGVYTTDLHSAAESVVARQWHRIVGNRFPGAVITDRSAITGGRVGGYLWLAHDARPRELALPGLTVVARRGTGPLPGDTALPGGLFLASRARALVENTAPSRSRHGRPRRTLSSDELDGWIDRICHVDGEAQLRHHRAMTEQLADALSAPAERIEALGARIGAALGSRLVRSDNPALRARAGGMPFDPDRIARFDLLVAGLRSAVPQSRRCLDPDSNEFRTQAFFEAYFSNYIEGTEFTVDEARQIVDTGIGIDGRHEDSHDVLGTFRIVADGNEMRSVAQSPDEFIDLLRSRHQRVMAARPDLAGSFKTKPNQAGSTIFVAPELVHGTLAEGWRRVAELDTGWERALFVMFLVAEVHPFADGNGRIARIMMNGELVASGQSKIIVPTGYRSEYLGALRRLSRDDDPTVFIKALRLLHDYTSQVDWGSDAQALADLAATNAFDVDEDAPRLRLLRTVRPAEAPLRSPDR